MPPQRSGPTFGSGAARFVPSSSASARPGFARPLPRPTASSASTPSRATQMGLGLGKGKGKGAVGLGNKTVFKRHKKLQRDTIQGITKGDIRRLARRGGIKRISATVYEDVRVALKSRLSTILDRISKLVESHPNNRKTVTVHDVIFTLRGLGTPIYGFDPDFDGRHRK